MTKHELELLHQFSILYYNYMESYLAYFLPGIEFMDPLMDVAWLYSSKNPDLHIKAFFDSSNSFSKYPKNLENFTDLIAPKMSLNANESAMRNSSIFEVLLDPAIRIHQNNAASIPIQMFKNIYKRMNNTSSAPAIKSMLWYSTLPCFDVRGVTSNKEGEKSILRDCRWKGVKIPCSAIFTTFPTDKGMCCAFNMQAAEEIFQGQLYSGMLKYFQTDDQLNAFTNSTLPDWYLKAKEPKSQAGLNKGLYVMLDAHSDILATGSTDKDFQGFSGLIDNSDSYPLILQNGFQIQTGHVNTVALSATKVEASEDLRSMDPVSRNCRFPDENSNLRIYKSYSQSNCFLECSIFYAQRMLLSEAENKSVSCIPWYLPFPDGDFTVCDPWESIKFSSYMFSKIPDKECAFCLPDCTTTIYKPVISTLPFKQCDESNLGISYFCNLDDENLPEPRIWGKQVIDEFKDAKIKPEFVKNIMSSQRLLTRNPVTFQTLSRSYNAYEKDMAVLQVFFDSPSIFLYQSQPSQTWVIFISSIGGLLGFCLGISIVSFVEVAWLCFRLGGTFFKKEYPKN